MAIVQTAHADALTIPLQFPANVPVENHFPTILVFDENLLAKTKGLDVFFG